MTEVDASPVPGPATPLDGFAALYELQKLR
jgi:hypothetical protein